MSSWRHNLHVIELVFGSACFHFPFQAKKIKSNRDKTPLKADQEKRKISPSKRENEPRNKICTFAKEDPFKSTKKATVEARRGLDFDQKILEKKQVSTDAGSPVLETARKRGVEELLWVDKYKPTSLKTVIGQQGDLSCANKLVRWLKNWHKNTSEDKHGNYRRILSMSNMDFLVCG